MKGILTPIIETGAINGIKTPTEGVELITRELSGKGRNKYDNDQISKITREVKQMASVADIQFYMYNAYLKYNGLGVIKK